MSTNSADLDPSIANFLIIPADEIRYDNLPIAIVSKLAIQKMDPFIATSALGELAQRDPQETKEAAERILEEPLWDPHITAFALTLLYDRDPDSAIQRMTKLVSTCEVPKVLEAMVESILSDSERFLVAPADQLARAIARRVAAAVPGRFSDVEQRGRFLKLFGE